MDGRQHPRIESVIGGHDRCEVDAAQQQFDGNPSEELNGTASAKICDPNKQTLALADHDEQQGNYQSLKLGDSEGSEDPFDTGTTTETVLPGTLSQASSLTPHSHGSVTNASSPKLAASALIVADGAPILDWDMPEIGACVAYAGKGAALEGSSDMEQRVEPHAVEGVASPVSVAPAYGPFQLERQVFPAAEVAGWELLEGEDQTRAIIKESERRRASNPPRPSKDCVGVAALVKTWGERVGRIDGREWVSARELHGIMVVAGAYPADKKPNFIGTTLGLGHYGLPTKRGPGGERLFFIGLFAGKTP